MEYRIQHLEVVDSTNTYLKALAADGERDLCVMADRQTGGRGRLGRTFESPAGAGLYMSFVCAPGEGICAETVTARAAVAVAQAIEELCGLSVTVKWVNDLHVNGRKICGILAESGIDPITATPKYFVMGIGINLRRGALSKELTHIATSVEDEGGVVPEADTLCRRILEKFHQCDSFVEEYRCRQNLTGNRVTVYRGRDVFSAVAVDVDDRCAMVLRLDDGSMMVLNSGEISLRKEGDVPPAVEGNNE